MATERFVERDIELQDMRKALIGDGSRRCVVLHGLRGISKSQLSIKYAMRERDSYTVVF